MVNLDYEQFLDMMLREIEICNYIKELSKSVSQISDLIIRNVRIIDPANGEISNSVDILIKDGIINRIDSQIDTVASVEVDGNGKFVFPGLIDMHVHHEVSNSQHLLHVANGILAVREMCGYPGILKLRHAINKGEIFAPRLKVASNMLNQFELDRYATIVDNPEKARQFVKEFKSRGYDYIKIWNRMPEDCFDAIIDESKLLNIPVVAHIPVGISVKKAVESGILTFEHFKGYLDDSTMKIPDQDYVTPTPLTGQWNCPTLKLFDYEKLIGEQALNLLDSKPELRYVSQYQKQIWKKEIIQKTKQVEEQGYNIPKIHFEAQLTIFEKLRTKGVEFIAGTDMGGGYPLTVPGFGLLEELEIIHEKGLSLLDALQAATYNAAKPLGLNIGRIRENSPASLFLVSQNPMDDLKVLRGEKDIIIAKRYISDKLRMEILENLEHIFNKTTASKSIEETENEIVSYFTLPENQIFLRPEYITLMVDFMVERGSRDNAKLLYSKVVEYTGNKFCEEKMKDL